MKLSRAVIVILSTVLVLYSSSGFSQLRSRNPPLAVVPNPGDQPSVEIIGLRCAHVTSVQDDFSAALGGQVEIAVAPPPWRWYTFHCNDPSNLPCFVRGFFVCDKNHDAAAFGARRRNSGMGPGSYSSDARPLSTISRIEAVSLFQARAASSAAVMLRHRLSRDRRPPPEPRQHATRRRCVPARDPAQDRGRSRPSPRIGRAWRPLRFRDRRRFLRYVAERIAAPVSWLFGPPYQPEPVRPSSCRRQFALTRTRGSYRCRSWS